MMNTEALRIKIPRLGAKMRSGIIFLRINRLLNVVKVIGWLIHFKANKFVE